MRCVRQLSYLPGSSICLIRNGIVTMSPSWQKISREHHETVSVSFPNGGRCGIRSACICAHMCDVLIIHVWILMLPSPSTSMAFLNQQERPLRTHKEPSFGIKATSSSSIIFPVYFTHSKLSFKNHCADLQEIKSKSVKEMHFLPFHSCPMTRKTKGDQCWIPCGSDP